MPSVCHDWWYWVSSPLLLMESRRSRLLLLGFPSLLPRGDDWRYETLLAVSPSQQTEEMEPGLVVGVVESHAGVRGEGVRGAVDTCAEEGLQMPLAPALHQGGLPSFDESTEVDRGPQLKAAPLLAVGEHVVLGSLEASCRAACGEGGGDIHGPGAWGSPSCLRGGVAMDPTVLRGGGRQGGDIPLGGKDMDSREGSCEAGRRDGS